MMGKIMHKYVVMIARSVKNRINHYFTHHYFTSLAFLALLAPTAALAQLPYSDLHLVSPSIARAGETLEVTITGENLEEVRALRFNDTRIVGVPVRSKPDDIYPKGQIQKNRFTVTIPAAVPPGIYETRSLGHFGLSTARPFLVLPADSNEIVETGDLSKRASAMPLPIETGVRGTVDGQKYDWFKIEAKKGERLLIEVWAERLDSRLDGRVIVTDAAGRELSSNNDYFGRDPLADFTAPADGEYFVGLSDVLYRGGGASYFYRLLVSRRPHIDFVWPPAIKQGTIAKHTLFGRNLPGGSAGSGATLDGKPLETLEVDITAPAEIGSPLTFTNLTTRQSILPGFEFSHAGSNVVRIGFSTAPVILEMDGLQPQTVTVPAEIAGRFDEPGDSDNFRFTAKKGASYWIESVSERLAANTDTVILLRQISRDAKGAETAVAVAESDDPPSFFSVNNQDATHADTNDASLGFTAAADGEYEVKLINNLSGGGIGHRYRLAIRAAAHDFHLITATEQEVTATNGRAGYPAAPLVRRGGSLAYRVLAPRRDGFDGDIVITAEGLPPGVTSEPLVLSGASDTGFLSVTAKGDAAEWSGPIRIVGRAKVDGKEVVRVSRNASLVWGVIFSDAIRVRTRLDLETVLSVSGEETAPALVSQADPAKVWKVELNGKIDIPVKLTDLGSRKGSVVVQPWGFPGLLRTPPTVTINEGAGEGVLSMTMKPDGNFAVKPGRFQFVLQGIGIAKYRYNEGAITEAKAEKARIEKLAQDLEKQVSDLKNRVAEAEKALASATSNAASATDAAKAELKKREQEATVALKAAKKALAEAEVKTNRATAEVAKADKEIDAATTRAKEKDTKFSTVSQPVTVEVTAPAEKKP
jgi:hypothetical protein